MRSILALGLLIGLCASANAATAHRAHRQHAVVRPNQGFISGPVSGFAYAPAGPRVRYDDQPSVYDNHYKNWGG